MAGKRLRRGARLWTVAVSTFKAETYRFLRLERPTAEEIAGGARMPPGTIHLPDWVETEWLKQFVAEQLVTVKTKRGFARLEWQKLRERNEALDARVYARAAAWIAGLDRWSEERWAEAEREVTSSAHRRPGRSAHQRSRTHPRARRTRGSAVEAAGSSEETNAMSWTETELAELRRAYASGTLRVSYDGKSVEYGSAADLLARIRTIEAEIASAAGRPKPRRSFAAFSKG